ncbi:protein of unknown function DUF224 cysteine-rich region domain protein [Desulfovibrio sp. X2]|uniref:(Fe-S)-binding protein n=1 Tax=Desulfovibrio sp. X2 TaxID=941449 RepID=UPI000358C188|nr:(Fe-S)-binding protein [Desulfovibrio sp. X2]EPR43371.1 protein of unknown function DUF224 cysteine-rich region domain protein [Desulfovibrio sp. X2]
MTVHLFVPCLVEHLAPEIAEDTARVLARAGCEPVLPSGQTCCGQPLYKSGSHAEARELARRFISLFESARCVVAPSGSCVTMVRKGYQELFRDDPAWLERARAMGAKTFELTEFLVRTLGRLDFGARFPAKVAFHDSCQVGRALDNHDSGPALLARVRELTLVPLARPETCCGFGGQFAFEHPEISATLAGEKLDDALSAGATHVVTAEPSCLLNLRGTIQRGGMPLKALHIAQVLARRLSGADESEGGRA